MCSLCTALGIDNGASSTEGRNLSLTKNEDGTYTMVLTEQQLASLTIRLATGLLMTERNGG